MFRFAILAAMLAFPAVANALDLIRCPAKGPSLHLAENVETDPAIDAVRLTYAGGSTFLIESAKGTLAATDFTGGADSQRIPDLVTINSALASGLIVPGDPQLARVLLDSADDPTPSYFMQVGQIFVQRLPNNLRGSTGTIQTDNSIFVFEIAGFCIAQFGQLNREPSADEYAALGRLDVVMVPVESGRTLDLATTLRMLTRLQTKVVLPMNWSRQAALDAFLDGLSPGFAPDIRFENTMTVSRRALPEVPVVTVLLTLEQASGA